MNQFLSPHFYTGVQNIIVALLVLLIGWLIAKAIGNLVDKALQKTSIDEKLFNRFQSNGRQVNSNRVIGKAVYYILLLFVLILFLNILNLTIIAAPLADLVHTILAFIPAVLKAALILVLAWLVASAVQWLIVQGSKKLNLLHLFYKLRMAKTEEEINSIVTKTGRFAFYLILLLFIPGVLHALNIEGVAQPFAGILASILAFVPKLLAAILIFVIGWFAARIIRNIVVNLLEAAGSERLVSKLKLDKVFEGSTLAQFIGNLLFVIILIPVSIAALERLDLRGIADPAISMLQTIMNMIPNILVAIALILVGVWLGRVLGRFVGEYLHRLEFDRVMARMEIGSKAPGSMKPSAIVGYIVQVLVVFFLTVQALHLVGLEFLVRIASAITAYLPNVLAAVLILGGALIVGNIVSKVLKNMLMGRSASILAGFAKYAIYVLAGFMALNQLGIATGIVTTAFTLILGGLALAFGLAFGLGGKDFAKKYLQKFDDTIENTRVKNVNPNQKQLPEPDRNDRP